MLTTDDNDRLDDPDRPRNARLEAVLGDRLRAAGFKPGPAYTGSPDGVYYNFGRDDRPIGPDGEPDDVQLVVVGPMRHTPFELAMMVGNPYRVIGLGSLEGDQAGANLVLNRGYWTVRLRTEADQFARAEREGKKPSLKVLAG